MKFCISGFNIFMGIACGIICLLGKGYCYEQYSRRRHLVARHKVVQRCSHGIYSHSSLLSLDMLLIAFVLLLDLLTHSVFCVGIMINSMETFTALLTRFVMEGFAAGVFIYSVGIEMLSSELNAHERNVKKGLFKALAVIIGVFTFFFVNVTFVQHSHSSLSQRIM